jgi:phosphatidylinositol alpha-mannosyltransferase
MESAKKRPLNVCVLVTYDISEDGGVKHHAFAVAQAMRRRGDKVTIIGPSRRPIDEPDVHGLWGVVEFQANGCACAFGIFCNPFTLRRLFREKRFDVIHVHEPLNPALGYWGTWLAPRTPHVATFHAFGEKESRALKVARAILAPTVRPFYQRAVAVSEPARRWAAPSWKQPMSIIPNGVSVKAFRPGAQPPKGEGPMRLLFVGKLSDPRKGFRYLAEAYGRLRQRGVDVTLDVVGDRTGASLPELPGLQYHGSLPLAGLIEQYRSCDVFVAPSTGQESFGLVLLEAMATARPVVCSAIEGYKQVVDERGARLVPPRDPEALEHSILELADPMRRWRMGVWNRNRAETYDWEHIATRVREEYLEAIDIARRGPVPAPVPAEPVALPVVAAEVDAAELAERQAGGV